MKKRLFSLILLVIACSTAITNPAEALFNRRFFMNNNILFYDGTNCIDSIASGSVQLAGDDNEQKALNFFMQKGLNLAQASGIIGNLSRESGLKPNIREGGQTVDDNYTPENGVGFGIAQWTFTARQQPLVEHMKSLGVPITDFGGQLGFIWKELEGQYLSTLNKLRSTDDPVQAAVIFHNGYEGSADSEAAIANNRGGDAKKIYDKYKDAPALSGASASQELSQPGGSPDSSANRGIGKVYIVGDSITEGAESEYQSKLKEAGASDIKISASVGSNLDSAGSTGTHSSGIDSIKADKDYIKEANTIIVAHGTNNLSHTRSGDSAIRDAIKSIKDSGTNGKIYWVDSAITSSGPSQYHKIVGDVNKSIHNNSSSGYSVISWAKEVDPNYNPTSGEGPLKHNSDLISNDGIHPTSKGSKKLVDLVVSKIKSGGSSNKNNSEECKDDSKSSGNFTETLKQYAWDKFKGLDKEAREEYKEAVKKAQSEGIYTGSQRYPGIDCGAFVTLLILNSGFDKEFNYGGKLSGGAGNTLTQEKWMKENWQSLGSGNEISPEQLQPGDVAINETHTFIYIGEVEGFESKIASASWDERAPMADTSQQPTDPKFRWYRKK